MTRTEPPAESQSGRETASAAAPSPADVDVDLVAEEAAEVDASFWDKPPPPSLVPPPRVQANLRRGAEQYRRLKPTEPAGHSNGSTPPPPPAAVQIAPVADPPSVEAPVGTPTWEPIVDPTPVVDRPTRAQRRASASTWTRFWGSAPAADTPPSVVEPSRAAAIEPSPPSPASAPPEAAWNTAAAAAEPKPAAATPSRGARSAVADAKRTARVKRLVIAGVVVLLAALVLFITGAFGGHSGAKSDAGHPTAVTVDKGRTTTCHVTGIRPSILNPDPCTFPAFYSGSEPAYVAVDVIVETQAGSGGTNLYNPGDPAHALPVTITATDRPVTFETPVAAKACPDGAPAHSTCYELDNQLLATRPITPGTAVGMNVTANAPRNVSNIYAGGTAQVILNTHAARAHNNMLACSGIAPSHSPPVAGRTCTPSGTFRWHPS